MTVFLRLTSVDFHGNAFSANLQIGTNKGVDGSPVNWFEILGDNGADDSGTWDWGRDEYNFVCIRLHSKKFSTIIGKVRAYAWGKGNVPPHEPHFSPSSTGDFIYIFAGIGATLHCHWRVIKILN
jgi:hypothetical protein